MTKKKTQIMFIHGGMTFKNNRDYLRSLRTRNISLHERIRWSDDYLSKKLGKNFEVVRPRMPHNENAKYNEWKIHFERYFPEFRNGIILIGWSLGAIFLAKYLSENKFPRKILSIYLICPPFNNTIPGDDLVGGFKLKSDLSMIEKNSKKINLLFSNNDNHVPLSHAKKYKNKLKNANLLVYNYGHFKISKFPEIIGMIKTDVKYNK